MKIRNFIKEERTILIICLFVFIISAAYAFYFRITPAVDAYIYDTVAMNILNGRGFQLYPDRPLLQDVAMGSQGPAYQYFLAGVYAVFGHHYEAIWLIQALLRALSALLLFLICKLIFGREGRLMGWIAAAFFGFYPDLIEISAMLMTETFFIFFSILFLYVFILYYNKPGLRGTFYLALTFGLTILIRSSIGLFLPVLIFYFWRQKALKFLFLFLILIAVILTPWTVRNYLVYHEFLPTMANFGFNPWVGNHEGGDGEGGNMPELFEAVDRYGVIGANHYAFGQFKQFVSEHPLTYIKLTAARIIKYFSFIRPMGFWFYQTGWSQLIFVFSSALASVFLFTFGFAGIFAAIRKERKIGQLIYLIAFAFLTCASIIPVLIETRYRLPIYPFMAIFAGFFIARILVLRKEYWRYLVLAFLILFFSSAINIVLDYNKIIEKLGQFL